MATNKDTTKTRSAKITEQTKSVAGTQATARQKRTAKPKVEATPAVATPAAQQPQEQMRAYVISTEAFSSPKKFAETFCHTLLEYRFYSEGTIKSIMEQVLRDAMISHSFWSNLAPIAAGTEKLDRIGEKEENVRYALLINSVNDESGEFVLFKHYLDDKIISRIDLNSIPILTVNGIIEKEITVKKDPVPLARPMATIKFNLFMHDGELCIGFKGKPSSINEKQISPLAGENGAYHQMKLSVEESLHGIQDHMSQHANADDICDVDKCVSKLGYHPEKGWCYIDEKNNVVPLVTLLSNKKEGKEYAMAIRHLQHDIQLLMETVEFMDNSAMYRIRRNTGLGMGNPPISPVLPRDSRRLVLSRRVISRLTASGDMATQLLSPEDYKVMQLANEFIGDKVRQVLNNNGASHFTVCPHCRVDDFVHVEGCPMIPKVGHF